MVASVAGADRVRRRTHRGAVARPHLPQGRRLHSGGPPYLCDLERRRESRARALQPMAVGGGAASAPRAGVRSVSAIARTAAPARQDAVRRRAADAGDRPRLGRIAETPPRGRAVRRPGADGGEGDLRSACANARPGHRAVARGAERPARGRHQRLLLRDGNGAPHQARRAGGGHGRRGDPATAVGVRGHEMATQTPKPAAAADDQRGLPAPAAAEDWPNRIFQTLREFGIRHVTYVPDAGHARLIELCHTAGDMEPTVLTTEEEGIGILAGAWLGGERGVLLMQSSGVGNCINTLSLAKVCGFPLLMIVTMRGEWGEANPWQVPMGQIVADNLRLAGSVVYEVTDPESAAPAVEAAARIAFNGGLTAAVLLSQRMLGTKLFKD